MKSAPDATCTPNQGLSRIGTRFSAGLATIGVDGSPFVQVFQKMGLDKAAGLINFVVITAALSSCNGGIFSSGRILHTLARSQQAPAWFGHIAPNGIPARAMLITWPLLRKT